MIDDEVSHFADALHRVGQAMPAARLPEDLWRRGRRRHRTRIALSIAVAAAAVLAVVLGVPLATAPRGLGDSGRPTTSPSAVPSTVYPPWPWQPAVQDSPRGPASILFSGVGPGLGLESNVAVIGRDGSYRMLLGGFHAGVDTHLSPDGTLVAMAGNLLNAGRDLVVADLSTGRIDRYTIRGSAYDDMDVLGWSPDSQQVVMAAHSPHPSDDEIHNEVGMFDVTTHRFNPVFAVTDGEIGQAGGAISVLHGLFSVAFSRNGTRLAVQAQDQLYVVDLTAGRVHALGAGHLAGPGAWSPDGHLAVVADEGCADGCPAGAAQVRGWRIRYLDPQTGAAVSGPALDPIDGKVVELLGWQDNGDLVVLSFGGLSPRLLALRPGGGQFQLMTLPVFVERIDIAQDLLIADRFGGSAPWPDPWPPAHWASWVGGALLVVLPLNWFRIRRRRDFTVGLSVAQLVVGLASALPSIVWGGWLSLSLVLAIPLAVVGITGYIRTRDQRGISRMSRMRRRSERAV